MLSIHVAKDGSQIYILSAWLVIWALSILSFCIFFRLKCQSLSIAFAMINFFFVEIPATLGNARGTSGEPLPTTYCGFLTLRNLEFHLLFP